MKKRILSATLLAAILIIWILLYLMGTPAAVTLPEYDAIAEVQLDAMKMDAHRLNADALHTLLDDMRAVTPLSRLRARQVERPGACFIVAFTDEQGNRTSWSFFRDGETYYMEAEDGSLYEGADFMAEYLPADSGWRPAPRGVSAGMYLPKDEEAAYAVTTGCDVRYWLYGELNWPGSETNVIDEVTIQSAKETILRKYRLYRYAVEHGYGIPDAEYERVTEERVADAATQEGAAEAGRIYEAAGSSLEEYVRQMSTLIWRVEDTADYMMFCFQNEFRQGSDTVDGVTYASAGEYSAARMNQVVLFELDSVDAAEFEAGLEAVIQR